MAIVTEQTGRVRPVMSVLRQFLGAFAVFLMTRQTSLVAIHLGLHLFVWSALVHRMATHARELDFLITGALDQPIELTASYADHDVRPEEIVEDIRMLDEHIGQPGLLGQFCRTNNGGCLFKIISGAIAKTILYPALGFIEPFHAMAEAADL